MYSDRASQSPPSADPDSPADAVAAATPAASGLLPQQGEVRPQAGEGAPASSLDSTSSPSVAPSLRPSVASAFPDCEAFADTFLAKIAAGTECLAAIAAFHHIPYPRFTLWLLEPSTQERLAALSVAIASAARLTATAALPDIVRGLKTTVDQLQSQTHMTIAPQGANHLLAESIILRRHRALIAAASLIYRISRFTCPSQHPPTPRHEPPPRTHTHSPTARDNSAPPRRGLPPLPKLDLPAIDFADPDSSPRNLSVASVNSVVQPRSVATDRSPPASGVDSASATPVDASPSSVFTSHFPHPTSDIDNALRILTAEYDLSPEEVAELRNDSHSWIRDFIPAPAAAKPAAPRSRRSRADDG